MAKRYGRNQRRAHRAEIEELKRKLYGDWGEPPADMPELPLRPTSKHVTTREDRYGIETTVDLTFVSDDHRELRKLLAVGESGTAVAYDGMCLYPVGVSRPLFEGWRQHLEIEAKFKRVQVAG